jgi:DNA-binding XRE family transcriptional regulator
MRIRENIQDVTHKGDDAVARSPDGEFAVLIGERLKGLRSQAGLSLERLSKLAGVSRGMLSQIELGRSVPTITGLSGNDLSADGELLTDCRPPLQRVQTIIGMEPHIRVIGMPQLNIPVIMSQHILSMSMLIMPVGSIVQLMPFAVISHVIMGFMGMPQQLIIGMPEHIIMHGVPFFIMTFNVAHMSFNISMDMPAAGVIMHCMPLSVMAQVI